MRGTNNNLSFVQKKKIVAYAHIRVKDKYILHARTYNFFFLQNGAFMILDAEQMSVFRAVMSDLRQRPIQTIGGLAGTGKSILVASLATALPRYAVGAFTGKAANVLREKGVERAQTLHSLIYKVESSIVPVTTVLPSGEARVRWETRMAYHLRDELEVDGILVDEASMVSAKLYADLCSFGLPLVFVGDHGQLEPVGEDPGLMADPDYQLETVHRNAGEIAHFAAHLRSGEWASSWRKVSGAGGKVMFIDPCRTVGLMSASSQTIVMYNTKRVEFNVAFRKTRIDQSGAMPVPGDRLICLRNTHSCGLFNGQQVMAEEVHSTKLIGVRTDAGKRLDVNYTTAAFNAINPEFDRSPDGPVPFDFAYAVTAHKAQGSEWDTGIVFEQFNRHWEHSRWTYTAATRFKQSLYWTNSKWRNNP